MMQDFFCLDFTASARSALNGANAVHLATAHARDRKPPKCIEHTAMRRSCIRMRERKRNQ